MIESLLSPRLWGQSALVASFLILILQFFWGSLWCVKGRQELVFLLLKGGGVFQVFLVTLAFGALIAAYVLHDFSLKTVFENSHTRTPLLYRVTGSWGNHEGSMLLWLWIMSLYGALMTRLKPSRFAHVSLALYFFLFGVTLLYILCLSNPFEALQGKVSQGLELNPILQDPALAFHPPTLYAGYVGFATVFSLALGGIVSKAEPGLWLTHVQRWTLLSWSFLTLGITLGSWWAYYELGWGGWWFWDPVENASLMPWLSATALLHLVKISRAAPSRFMKTTYFLATLTFTLCLLGTFLVRSGSLSSVHAFAHDPGRGLALLGFTLFLMGMSLIGLWHAWRQNKAGIPVVWSSREGIFGAQTLVFMALLVTVLLGTLYPLCLASLSGTSLSVGAPYFHKTFVPISFIGFVLMGVGFFLPSRRPFLLKAVWSSLERPVLLTLLWILGWSSFVEPCSPVSLLGSSLAFWVFWTSFTAWTRGLGLGRGRWTRTVRAFWRHPLHHHSSFVAHTGVAMLLFGMTVDHTFRHETTVALGLHETVSFGAFEVTLQEVERVRESTFMAERGLVEVRRNKKVVSLLRPEKRFYPSHQVLTTETALYPHGFSNLYVALGGLLPGPKWTLRLYHHPLVLWLWIGGILMALGSLMARSRIRGQGRRDPSSLAKGEDFDAL